MKTKKRGSSSSSRFSRGTKVSSKGGSRRHARKSSSKRSESNKGGFIQKLEELSPL